MDEEKQEGGRVGALAGFRSDFKSISKIALPMTASFTFSMAVVTIGILASHLDGDEEHTASIALITTMMNAVMLVALSPLFAISNYTSKLVGQVRLNTEEQSTQAHEDDESKHELIAMVTSSGFLISSATCIPAFLFFFFSGSLLENLLGQDDEVSAIAQEFLRPYSFAVPAMLMRMCFEQVMFSFGRSVPAMKYGLTNFTLCTGLAIWLGFGGLGVSRMGLKGITLAYVLEAYMTALALGLYIAMNKRFVGYQFFNFHGLSQKKVFNQAKELLKIGGPITLVNVGDISMSFGVSIIAGLAGKGAQAVLAYPMQLSLFLLIPLVAFGQTCAQMFGRYLGERKYLEASSHAKHGVWATLSYLFPFCFLVSVYPKILETIFGGSVNSSQLAKVTPIVSMGILFNGAGYNMLQELMILLDLKVTAAISLASVCVGLAISATLGLATSLGVLGVSFGYMAGYGASMVALGERWRGKVSPQQLEANYFASIPLENAHA